jgi:hypothetical protein
MPVDRIRRLQFLQAALLLDEDQAIADECFEDRRSRRRWWVRPWIQRRPLFGQYEQLMEELRTEDVQSFINFTRFDPVTFEELVTRLAPRIAKKSTFFRKPLSEGLKLAIVLRHFASGDSYKSLMYGFRVSKAAIVDMVPKMCDAIIDEFGDEVMHCPTTSDEWKAQAQRFETKWNLPHCVGAIDGKHVAIKCPSNSGSTYFNYKGFYSLVLFAMVDADYKFTWVDVGANGGASDCQIFNASDLKAAVDDGTIGFPAAEPVFGDNEDMPFFIVGDDAFPLRTWLMKPFSRRSLSDEELIFNYRLSRGRRVVENAFGILANRFQVLLTTMRQQPATALKIVLACICLHNFLRMRNPALHMAHVDKEGANHSVVPGEWRQNAPLEDLQSVTGNAATAIAKRQRMTLKHYFNSPVGAVPWQWDMI